jgi:hypothetical protein
VTGVRWLVDSSAITRLVHAEVAEVLGPLVDAGQVGTCGVVDLRLYARVRDLTALPTVSAARSAAFHWLAMADQDFRRALEVQALLAGHGQQVAGWPCLLVAAVAERHRVAVLHYDEDFDLITKVTGQGVQWVVPTGSLRGSGT